MSRNRPLWTLKKFAAFAGFLALVGAVVDDANAQIKVEIDADQVHQTLDGFGASGAWWHTWVPRFPEAEQQRMLDLLFTTDKGVGLSIFRYNIPAGSDAESVDRYDRRTPNLETSPGEYDLSRDEAALKFLTAIRERGVERFVLFANSPPPRMTITGMASGGPGGKSNLRPGMAGDFATYVLDVAERVKERCELPTVAVSPINEPQWDWGRERRHQEGCYYTPAETVAVIRATIEQNLERGLGFEVEAPESGAWNVTMPYAKALFADPLINKHLHKLAVHSYWTSPRQRRAAAEQLRDAFPDKQIDMSEFCEMRSGHDLSIEGGLLMARVIHEDLTVGNVISWQWWLAIAEGGYRDGLIYANPRNMKVDVTKRLWVLGQWSKFVRPGYQRVEATAGGREVRPTAFLSPDGTRLVVVMINADDAAATVTLDLSGFDASTRSGYVTDADRDLETMEINGDALELSPKSVTTIVLHR